MRSGPERRRRTTGFSLVELLIVITIIGLLTSFVLVVSMQGIERARERASQSLLAKLDAAVQDRMNQLLALQPPVNLAHKYLAWPESVQILMGGQFPATTFAGGIPGMLPTDSQRAETIARIDDLKAQIPDVFFVQVNPTSLGVGSDAYPLNFAAVPYTAGTAVPGASTFAPYVLPIGNSIGFAAQNVSSTDRGAVPYVTTPSGQYFPPTGYSIAGTGIFGASYTAAAGILKNLGNGRPEITGVPPSPYLPTGYDGIDNDGDGMVDEFNEGVNAANLAAVQGSLAAHKHNTARSEALYAFLIESPGALLGADNFKDSEIGDTDGDGLPEFLDGWGNPIQFFRWPSHYHSDLQRGVVSEAFDGLDNNAFGGVDDYAEGPEYLNAGEQRESNPFDPSNQLVSPVWWSSPTAAQYPSTKSTFFQGMFFSLCEPYATTAAFETPAASRWDRLGYFKRRQFALRFLILSSGADGLPGVPLLSEAIVNTGKTGGAAVVASHLVLSENIAGAHALNLGSSPYLPARTLGNANFDNLRSMPGGRYTTGDPSDPGTIELIASGQDDVTNHNLRVTGGTSK